MSQLHSVLGSLVLGYAPVMDKQRQVLATRLTLAPLRPDLAVDGQAVLDALQAHWPDGVPPLQLNAMSEPLLLTLLASPLPASVSLELPSFMLSDPQHLTPIAGALQNRVKLLLKGRPAQALAPELNGQIKTVLLDLGSDRHTIGIPLPAGMQLGLYGARGVSDVVEGFQSQATQIAGWPIDEDIQAPTPAPGKPDQQTDLQVIVELMSRVDQGEDIDRLEQTLKRDPSLAFKLLRYLNSAAFGLPVEVTSFRHAIMLLGYPRLKRWLALLLTTASKDHNMRPIMYGALRRGLLLEELSKSMNDAEVKDEMFICGLFSLLDHMLHQPFEKLLQSIPVPERVRQALVDGSGPYRPYIELVVAIERESVFDIRAAMDKLMLGADELNNAVLNALAKATQLE